MACKILLVFCCVVALATGEVKERKTGRKSRFISFDTDKNDIQVSLDFTVPFLSIPIKQTVDSIYNGFPGLAIPKINLNPSALAFGGFIILATSVLLPIFSKGVGTYGTNNYYRVLDKRNDETNIFMDLTNQFMNVSRGCPLRIACWMSQRSNDLASTQTVEQIMSNKLVPTVFNTAKVEEAIAYGTRGGDCSYYKPCPIEERHLPILISNFDILTRRNFT